MQRSLLLAALLACAAAGTAAAAAASPRGTLLALLADPADRASRFGPFFDGLEAAGWALDVRPSAKPAAGAADAPSLKAWDTWAYDGVVVLPGKTNGEAKDGGGRGVGAGRSGGHAPIQTDLGDFFFFFFLIGQRRRGGARSLRTDAGPHPARGV